MTIDPGPCGIFETTDTFSGIESSVRDSDPVGQSIRGVFASLDELIALAADPETRAQVCAEKIALGQMLTRCQTLVSFALAQESPKFKVIGRG